MQVIQLTTSVLIGTIIAVFLSITEQASLNTCSIPAG